MGGIDAKSDLHGRRRRAHAWGLLRHVVPILLLQLPDALQPPWHLSGLARVCHDRFTTTGTLRVPDKDAVAARSPLQSDELS